MEKLKIIIVDDEKRIRTSLIHVLKLHYLEADVIGEAENIQQAREVIKLNIPDILLLDIKMPGGTGFDLLKQLMPISFKTIFITAFDQYAIEAIKFSALDYLLKPVIPGELVKALDKAKEEINKEKENIKLKTLINNIEKKEKKIVLNTQGATFIIDVREIVRCEADRNYTNFFLMDKKRILVSGGLKEYEDILKSHNFIRPHHSHLVNVSLINRLEKRNGGVLVLKDGSEVPVSIRKHAELAEILRQINK